VNTLEVPDSERRDEVGAMPQTPATRSKELPVDNKMFGEAPLAKGTA
jgi:hypothetical protein